ncbi:hypothetical protein CCACVL1_15092, partial [Corchorus capsularis]
MASMNGNVTSIQEAWEVDEQIYNAVEFEIDKGDEDHEDDEREREDDKDNEYEGEDDNDNVIGNEILVYENEYEVFVKPHVGMAFD